MTQEFDYKFGLTELIPSKQDEREGNRVTAFKKVVESKIPPEILKSANLPSKKEVFVSVLQFFASKKEYAERDVDNMSKTILDCLKGKLYIDDSQVRTLLISKKISTKVPVNFAFVGFREIKGDTDVGIVQQYLLEQAVTLFQTSAKTAQN
ncbi:MAG: hypothetical protein G01um10148_733 [Parcubacteria group bacterium Gr01-1014_8]|nr:MAG: hypothetical protein G01um10148_733 [Parcubacteria group bacterium Gr01-1014_8]